MTTEPTLTETKQQLTDKINAFLSERRESPDGGWARITTQDCLDLSEIIHLLVILKCEPDPDGDRPINWNIVNRRMFEPQFWNDVPYSHLPRYAEEYTEEDRKNHAAWRLEELLYNLSRATKQVEDHFKMEALTGTRQSNEAYKRAKQYLENEE